MSDDVGFATEALFSLPPGCAADAVTADGHVVAFWVQDDDRLRFIWDGDVGAPFDGLAEMRDKAPAIFSSDDGAHLAYVGMRGDVIFVGRDGATDPPMVWFTRSVPPVFSPDGIHLAYGGGFEGDDFRLVVDGRILGDLPIAPTEAVFSPDGERLAYAELRRQENGRPELRIILDGRPGPWFAGMRNAVGVMQFSPDSRRFAYQRIDGEMHCQWVVDAVAQRLTNEIPVVNLSRIRGIGVVEPPVPACFSPDSRRFAYFADVVEKGVAIIEDDVPGPLFKGVGMPVFSPDSRRLAYLAQTYGKNLCVVIDGVAGPEWPATWGGTPTFSADSRHVATTITHTEGSFLRKRHFIALAVDGDVVVDVAGDDASEIPAFSPDGERVAWWFRDDGIATMMVNESPHTDEAIALSDPVFTCTGHLVYAAVVTADGKASIMIDGQPGPLADMVVGQHGVRQLTGHPSLPFAISPDGEHVAWTGTFGEEDRPVIDDRVGPPFDQVLGWSFDGAGVATWWAQRGEVVYRVTA